MDRFIVYIMLTFESKNKSKLLLYRGYTMQNNTSTSQIHGEKIWDDILKAIVERMPQQLLPLIEDVFGVTYPDDVSIIPLATEHIIPGSNTKKFASIYSDITLQIGNDIYHFESQMSNEDFMSIRMIRYDFHIALSNSVSQEDNGTFTIEFPKSVVIYPAPNRNIPDKLTCNIKFPDGSMHRYEVPTLKVQSYDLNEIQKKHLTLFLPFKLLQFRPRLNSKKNPLTANELTEFINEIIFILKEDLNEHRITKSEYEDYIDLIDQSANRVFQNNENFKEQVVFMTKSLITLPSERYEQYEKQLAEKDAELAMKDATLAEKDATLAEKDAEIKKLRELLNNSKL